MLAEKTHNFAKFSKSFVHKQFQLKCNFAQNYIRIIELDYAFEIYAFQIARKTLLMNMEMML